MAKRIEKWDILKFFLIFTVVLGHIADFYTDRSEGMQSLYLFIYTFHMPLFIFVSGLFSKRTVNEFRFDKIAGYMIVYLFTKLVLALYNFIARGEFRFGLFVDGGLPWFMLAMFTFPIITYLVRKVKFPVVLMVSITVALIVGYFKFIGDVFSISRIIVYFPFFYVGYVADAKVLKYVCDKAWVKAVSAVILLVIAIGCFGFGDVFYVLRPLFTGRNPYAAIQEHFAYAFVLRLFCYVISALACFSVVALIPNHTKIPAFKVLGARTLSVYVYHYIALYILFNHIGLKELLAPMLPWWALVVMIPLTFALTVLLSLNLFYKPLEFMMNLPTTIKQKIKARS